MLVYLMHIAAGRISLPELDKGMGQWAASRIKHAPDNPNPLSKRLSIATGIAGKIAVDVSQPVEPKDRHRWLTKSARHDHQWLLRSPSKGRFITGGLIRRVRLPIS